MSNKRDDNPYRTDEDLMERGSLWRRNPILGNRILTPISDVTTTEEKTFSDEIRELHESLIKENREKMELAKLCVPAFVFHWENSYTVTKVLQKMPELDSVELAIKIADLVRKKYEIALKDLPVKADFAPPIKKIQRLS